MLYMLSTLDNPYNPHHQWDQWLAYDRNKGHYSSELLARIAKTSDELSDADYDVAVNNAIDDIVTLDVIGIYIKVSPDFKPRPIALSNLESV